MKKTRIAIISLLVLTMLSSLVFVMFTANEGADTLAFSDNWTTQSGRFSAETGKLVLNGDNSINDAGFSYASTADGGIRVTAAAPGTELGLCATSVLTSKAKTELDGLSVKILPDDLVFTKDEGERSEVVTVMWTADQIGDLNAVGHYDHTATNGIRNIAQPTKGLCVTLNNSYNAYNGTMKASNVMITLINGDFTDACDSRLGYRWSFTARNMLNQSPNSDGSSIRQSYADVDITDGLTVSVRADAELGFIVSLNGVDYCRAEDIAYYPNNMKNSYDPNSFTSLARDINLSALEGETGYVSVSVTGTRDTELGYAYTLSEINGTPASVWGAAE